MMAEIAEFVIDKQEKIVGKRRKYWLPAISPFPTMFSKDCFSIVIKTHDCLVKD